MTQKNFTINPVVTTNPDGMPLFGLLRKGFVIYNPHLSSCGRFSATPEDHGMTNEEAQELADINNRLKASVEAAQNAVALAYQTEFGVTDGGSAGIYFSDDQKVRLLQQIIVELIQQEYSFYDADSGQTESLEKASNTMQQRTYFAVSDETTSSGAVDWFFTKELAQAYFNDVVAEAKLCENADAQKGIDTLLDEINIFSFEMRDDATPEEITDQADELMWNREYSPISSHNRGASVAAESVIRPTRERA